MKIKELIKYKLFWILFLILLTFYTFYLMYKTHKITEEKFESIINVHYDETILSPTYKLYIKDVTKDTDELTNLKLPDTSEYVMFPSYINYSTDSTETDSTETDSTETESSVLIYDKTLNKLHYYCVTTSSESCKTSDLSGSDFENDKIKKIVTNDTVLFVLTENGNLYRMDLNFDDTECFVVEPFIDTISANGGDGPADNGVVGGDGVVGGVGGGGVGDPIVETTCSDDDSSGNTYPNCEIAEVEIHQLSTSLSDNILTNIKDIAMSDTCLYVLFNNTDNELKYITVNSIGSNTNNVTVNDIVGNVNAIASDFESTFCIFERTIEHGDAEEDDESSNLEIHIVHDDPDTALGVLPGMSKDTVVQSIKLLCRKNWCGFITESKCHLCDVSIITTIPYHYFNVGGVDGIENFDNKTIHLVKIVVDEQEEYTLQKIKDNGLVSFSPNDIAAGIDSDYIYYLSKQEATSNRSPPRTLWKTTNETVDYNKYISRTRILDGLTNIIAMFPSFIDEAEVFLLDSSHRLYLVNGLTRSSNEITFDTTPTNEKPVKVVTNNVKAYVLTTRGNIYPIYLTTNTVDTTSASADRVTSGDAIDFALSSESNPIVYINKKGVLYDLELSPDVVNYDKKFIIQIIGHPDSQYMYLLGASDGQLYRYPDLDQSAVDGMGTQGKDVSLLCNGDYYGTYNNTGVYILSTMSESSTVYDPLIRGFKSASIMKADSLNPPCDYLVGIDNNNDLVRIDLSDASTTPIKKNVSLFAGKNIENIFYLPNGEINQCHCELTKDDCHFCDTTDFENDTDCEDIMNGLNDLIQNSCNPSS